jgi:hypothetical protein
MKAGKYITLGSYENVKIGYGTVDHKNLKTIYLKLNSWVEPEDEIVNYNSILSKTKRCIKLHVNELDSELFKKENIVDIDIRTKGIKMGKKSFMNLEVTLFTKKMFDIRSCETKNHIQSILQNIIDNDLTDKNLFNFHVNKK